MDRTEEFITTKSYDIKIEELVNDYINKQIPSLCFDDLDDEIKSELAGLYFFSDKERAETAEELIVEVIRDEIRSWGALFIWGGLSSMGYGKKYINRMHETMFKEYISAIKKYIQLDIDSCYSRIDNYTYKDIDEMF